MDKKIRMRILGILVIIAFIIILLPLFETNKDLGTQKIAINMPEFPDQSIQVGSGIAIVEPPPLVSEDNHHEDTNNSIQQEDASNPIVQTINPEASIEPKAKPVVNTGERLALQKKMDHSLFVASSEKENKSNLKEKTIQPTIVAVVSTVPNKKETIKKFSDDGLIKLKKAVWVIQIGSFADKTNALRLVNQLRGNGYRAFIQQVSTTFGSHTRVLVGPLSQQEKAKQLAEKLESELHVKGVVMNYKPLDL